MIWKVSICPAAAEIARWGGLLQRLVARWGGLLQGLVARWGGLLQADS